MEVFEYFGSFCANCKLFGWEQPDPKASLLKRCGGCWKIYYCSQECQEEHWRKLHKRHCKFLSGKRGLEGSVVHIKDTIDTQTVPLFDHSLAEIDEGGRGVLVSLAGQLAQLVTVISSLSSQGGVITELGADTLDTKLNVTGLVLLYTQVRRIFWSPL